ncbi:MAG: hemerythrin domain-containing protein [Pseudomonadales bacterium]
MAQPRIIRRLLDDHAHFYRIFGVLENQVALLAADGEGPDFRLLEDVIEYIIEYPDAVHHPLEDRLLAAVVEKGVDGHIEELILANRRQHSEISERTKKLHTDIQHVLIGAVIPSEQLKTHIDEYIELQRRHLVVEERELFPLAERLLEADDWKFLEDESLLRQDPLFEHTLERFSDLYRYIVDQDQATGK